jgi:hypothetical protein
MENLKKDFVLVGYVRKSVKSAQHRVKNIQSMVNNSYLRSNMDKCFVSYSSDANSDITTRDFRDDIKTLEKIKDVHGNIQSIYNICIFPLSLKVLILINPLFILGMIDFISSSKQKVCIVIIDYAGLSTDPVNIQASDQKGRFLIHYIEQCNPAKWRRINCSWCFFYGDECLLTI